MGLAAVKAPVSQPTEYEVSSHKGHVSNTHLESEREIRLMPSIFSLRPSELLAIELAIARSVPTPTYDVRSYVRT